MLLSYIYEQMNSFSQSNMRNFAHREHVIIFKAHCSEQFVTTLLSYIYKQIKSFSQSYMRNVITNRERRCTWGWGNERGRGGGGEGQTLISVGSAN